MVQENLNETVWRTFLSIFNTNSVYQPIESVFYINVEGTRTQQTRVLHIRDVIPITTSTYCVLEQQP